MKICTQITLSFSISYLWINVIGFFFLVIIIHTQYTIQYANAYIFCACMSQCVLWQPLRVSSNNWLLYSLILAPLRECEYMTSHSLYYHKLFSGSPKIFIKSSNIYQFHTLNFLISTDFFFIIASYLKPSRIHCIGVCLNFVSTSSWRFVVCECVYVPHNTAVVISVWWANHRCRS